MNISISARSMLQVKFIALTVLVLGLAGLTNNARADFHQDASESLECMRLLREPLQQTFRGPAEEINHTNRYTSCWAESLIIHSKTSQRSFIGRGMELFANPAFVEALGFSKQLCFTAHNIPGFRGDYPCWFETATATQGVSVEAAARKEAPKILFANTTPNRDGTNSVEYILCTNDDPTKPKEYSKGCNRGKKMVLTEYGRGDINGDHEEDILVTIKYGDNTDEHKKCFIAGFTRKEDQLMRMISFSPNGLCE